MRATRRGSGRERNPVAEAGELYAALGLRIDRGQWARGDAAMASAKRGVDALHGAYQDKSGKWRAASGRFLSVAEKAKVAAKGVRDLGDAAEKAGKKTKDAGSASASAFSGVGKVAAVAGAYMGFSAAKSKLIDFNATAEDSAIQIAGMLAMSKKTDFNDQLGNANMLMEGLSKKAASLPGTTAEYVSMLGNITQPVLQAGLGMEDLEALTVGAVTAAKALGEDAGAAARDIGQALRGQAGADDPFIGKLLDNEGYAGQDGRKKFNDKTAKERAAIVKKVLTNKQLSQMGEAQGNTFGGVLSTLQDAISRFFGAVGKPLFTALVGVMKDLNAFLDANAATIKEVAAVVASGLSAAFEGLKVAVGYAVEAVKFFIENSELGMSVLIALGIVVGALALKMAALWVIAAAPVVILVAAIAAVVYAIRYLMQHPEKVKAAFAAAWKAVGDGAGWVWDKLKSIGERIKLFFVEDIPNAIKSAFKAAFEYIANLPVVSQMIWLVNELKGLMDRGANPAHAGMSQTQIDALPATELSADEKAQRMMNPKNFMSLSPVLPSGGAGAGTTINATLGDINVTSNNADPKAVGVEVRRVVADELGNMLRRTKDEI